LRLFPSTPFQLLRYCPEGGMIVDGHQIPAGTPVGISPMTQNRDKAVFGTDANEFRPERWLGSTEESSGMESANMTFGGNGPRGCIGKNISLVSLARSLDGV
jgi:cytochrome P450